MNKKALLIILIIIFIPIHFASAEEMSEPEFVTNREAFNFREIVGKIKLKISDYTMGKIVTSNLPEKIYVETGQGDIALMLSAKGAMSCIQGSGNPALFFAGLKCKVFRIDGDKPRATGNSISGNLHISVSGSGWSGRRSFQYTFSSIEPPRQRWSGEVVLNEKAANVKKTQNRADKIQDVSSPGVSGENKSDTATQSSNKIEGDDPLHTAVRAGRMGPVQMLIANGENVNKKNKDGQTPLHLSARNESVKIAELLISRGANVNAKDNEGETPLHLAVSYGHVEMVKFLISKGASVNEKNKYGDTPLKKATLIGNEEIAGILKENGAKE